MIFFKLTAQHRRQRGCVTVQRDVGDEPQPPLVDANQGHAKPGELAANAQHGAIAAHHQAKITFRADGVDIQYRVAGNAHVVRGVVLKNHLATLCTQKMGNVFQHPTRGRA